MTSSAFNAKAKKPALTPQELGSELLRRCSKRSIYLKTAVQLIESGADLGVTDPHGQTALMFCIGMQTPEHLALAKILIEKGAPLDSATRLGTTALSWGICNGNIDGALMLIKAGCRTDICEDNGMSPLHLAAERGHATVVNALIKAGADLAAQNRFGYTPFNQMSASAKYEGYMMLTAELLLKAGADYKTPDKNGLTPYDHLSTNMAGDALRYPAIRQLLVDRSSAAMKTKMYRIAESVLSTPVPLKKPHLRFRKK